MVAWLRKLILRYSAITKSLREATKQDAPVKVQWSKEMSDAYDKLKEIIAANPVMGYPDMNKELFIHVDMSAMGIGAILTQLGEGGRHRMIEYASNRMSRTQENYLNSVREGLGVLWALDHFRYYILGNNTTVYCNCSAVIDIFSTVRHMFLIIGC